MQKKTIIVQKIELVDYVSCIFRLQGVNIHTFYCEHNPLH